MLDKLDLLIDKVRTVTGDEESEWGKMHIQHMVEHLILMLKISTGKIKVNLLVDEKQLDLYKEIILKDEPFEKNLKNPMLGDEPSPLVFNEIATAKKKLFEEFETFKKFFNKDSESKTMHPLLGFMNKDEWIKYHIKHLSHHLVQFGLYKYSGSLY